MSVLLGVAHGSRDEGSQQVVQELLVLAAAQRPGLRAEAEFVRSLGFGAKSAIHPRQIPILHEVFAPSPRDLEWARQVLAAFEAAGRGATRLPDGEFVDLAFTQATKPVVISGTDADDASSFRYLLMPRRLLG